MYLFKPKYLTTLAVLSKKCKGTKLTFLQTKGFTKDLSLYDRQDWKSFQAFYWFLHFSLYLKPSASLKFTDFDYRNPAKFKLSLVFWFMWLPIQTKFYVKHLCTYLSLPHSIFFWRMLKSFALNYFL